MKGIPRIAAARAASQPLPMPGKLSHKLIPAQIVRWARFQGHLRGCRDFTRADLEATFDRICGEIDLERINNLRNRMRLIHEADPAAPVKFLDLNYWLRLNICRAVKLKLHLQTGLRILDLGSGAGYFVAVCRHFGHAPLGIDMPRDLWRPSERAIYEELLAALSCETTELLIQSFEPLRIDGRFDLITGYLVCFNNHKLPDEWSRPQWEFFVGDALTHLNRCGALILELNTHRERYGRLKWFDRETLKYFRSVGSLTEKGNVLVINK